VAGSLLAALVVFTAMLVGLELRGVEGPLAFGLAGWFAVMAFPVALLWLSEGDWRPPR
jgi:hypothetical protein